MGTLFLSFSTIPADVAPTEAARLEAARLFSERAGTAGFAYGKFPSGRPRPHAGFDWSVSHSWRALFVAVCDAEVGVDVETVKPRSDSVWNALHPSMRAFEPFQNGLLEAWTAAESVTKLLGDWVDAVGEVRVENVRTVATGIDGIDFSRVSDTICRNRRFTTYVGTREEFAYSLTVATHA